MEEITASWVRGRLPRRDPMGHKGTFGKVLCICGSVGFSGAAVFAGRAAVRTGSGLVYLGVPEPVWPVAALPKITTTALGQHLPWCPEQT